MKILYLAVAGALVTGALAQEAPKPPAPPVASPDFQRGFCAGWSVAFATGVQNYGNWRDTVLLGRTLADLDKDPQGKVVGNMLGGVALYVLVQPTPGRLTLGDGAVIDCAQQK